MFKLVLEKAEESEIKLPTSAGSGWKRQENSRETSTSALLTMTKPLIVWTTAKKNTKNCVENSERDGNIRPPHLPLEKSVCRLRSNS